MGNYERLRAVAPELAERDLEHDRVTARVAEMAAFLPDHQRRLLAEAVASFHTLRHEHTILAARYADENQRLKQALQTAAGLLSTTPEFAGWHPVDVLAHLSPPTVGGHP